MQLLGTSSQPPPPPVLHEQGREHRDDWDKHHPDPIADSVRARHREGHARSRSTRNGRVPLGRAHGAVSPPPNAHPPRSRLFPKRIRHRHEHLAHTSDSRLTLTFLDFLCDPRGDGVGLLDSALMRSARRSRCYGLSGSCAVHNGFEMRTDQRFVVGDDEPALLVGFHLAGNYECSAIVAAAANRTVARRAGRD